MKKIMWRKTTNAEPQRIVSNIFIMLLLIIISLPQVFLTSCKFESNTSEQLIGSSNYNNDASLYLFDYKKITLENTGSIDLKIKNYNLYLDIYEDLVILGEVENVSSVNKTNIEITFNFYDKYEAEIMSVTIPAPVDYLRRGSRLPFYFYLTDRQKFIDICRVKIGVNYKDYYERFEGNPIVENERYRYEEDYLIIEGRIINIGVEKIRNLKLFCTFYNDKNQVVFIEQCYLPEEEMIPEEEQGFTLKVLLDEYLPDFTNYKFEVFFEDEIKEPV